jgi:hypothetical protein
MKSACFVLGHTTRIRNFGHKTLHNNFFSSPDLFNDLLTKAVNCHGNVRPDRKITSSNSGRKLRLKQSDMKTRVKGDLAAVTWEDK